MKRFEDFDLDDLDADPTPRTGLMGALYRHRKLLGAAALLWFGLVVGGGIFLSQLDARLGLHVFGSSTWVAGEPAVLRVALRDLRVNSFEPLGPVKVRFVGPEEERTAEQVIDETAGPFLQGELMPPRAGSWTVELSTMSEKGPLLARFGADVQPAPPPTALPPPPKKKTPPRADRGPLQLDIAPTDHVLAGGLPGRLTVRATLPDGRPAPGAQVKLEMKEGRSGAAIPSSLTTDRHGLASFAVHPMHPTFWFELEGVAPLGEQESGPPVWGAATRRLKHVATQFTLDTPARVAPGAAIPFRVRALHRSGPVFVDVWHGERWLGTTSVTLDAGQAEGRVELPDLSAEPAIVWLQAYRSAYLPQDARGGAHVLVSAGDAAESTRWLAGRLSGHGVLPEYSSHLVHGADADPGLLRYLLGRTQRPEHDPALLADSGDTARQTVQVIKATWQRRFVIALVASGALMFGVLGFLVFWNYRDVQRRWAALDGDVDGDAGTRKRVLVDAGYIFGVLALFLLGMVQLILSIRW